MKKNDTIHTCDYCKSTKLRESSSIGLLSNIAKDLIDINFEDEQKLGDVHQLFYNIMRKYGIRAGSKSGNGITFNNPEWTMCLELFESRLRQYFIMKYLFLDCPEDLKCY